MKLFITDWIIMLKKQIIYENNIKRWWIYSENKKTKDENQLKLRFYK